MAEKKKEDFVSTPLMKQYYELKNQYPDTILLYRVGDFYETFGDDAVETAKILGIILTKRGKGDKSELAGFPYHAIDTYLPKFLKAGKKVAVCEQLENPKETKGIVKRGVTEVVTPALSYNDKTADTNENNYLASVYHSPALSAAAFLDLFTGDFFFCEGDTEEVYRMVQSMCVKEIIVEKKYLREFERNSGLKVPVKTYEDWVFGEDFAKKILNQHFGTLSLKGLGIEDNTAGLIAAGAIMNYLNETKHTQIDHIYRLYSIDKSEFIRMDNFTVENLELVNSSNEKATTLLQVLDKTQTNMGRRLMQRYILLPLLDKDKIERRQDIVQSFFDNRELSDSVSSILSGIGDVERVISKLAFRRIQPSELFNFKDVLKSIRQLKDTLLEYGSDILKEEALGLDCCEGMLALLDRFIAEDAPNNVIKGNYIASGVDSQLDYYREISTNGKNYINKTVDELIEKTNISSLKLGYNNVFGYYLEVTNTHKDKVPESWIRKQTLANAERYITEELKEIEDKILSSQEEIRQLESAIYDNLLNDLLKFTEPLQNNAGIISRLDCLNSFACVAREYGYVRPTVDNSRDIDIVAGRHPVIERTLGAGEEYISNDLYLDCDKEQLRILTGPNMSGKSAYLRQNALIVLLAQTGSFVPARKARIGIVDRIFTRIGSSDNISRGESTFMVEMNEASRILNNLSERSLILFDELGRGTSTFDGVSLAWAICSYIHSSETKAKTLFATHYYELTGLENVYRRIKNYHVSVKEINGDIVFLRKVTEGGCTKSFGINVAVLAGIPKTVIQEAKRILNLLEGGCSIGELAEYSKGNPDRKKEEKRNKCLQLSFEGFSDSGLLQLKQYILQLDIETIRPIDALMKLDELKKMAEKL